jgi:hypothetical protein
MHANSNSINNSSGGHKYNATRPSAWRARRTFNARPEDRNMTNILGSIALAYIAGSGTVTNTAVVGRGLFSAARKAVEGEHRHAAAEALGALAAPALMSYAATASLVMDALEGARHTGAARAGPRRGTV